MEISKRNIDLFRHRVQNKFSLVKELTAINKDVEVYFTRGLLAGQALSGSRRKVPAKNPGCEKYSKVVSDTIQNEYW